MNVFLGVSDSHEGATDISIAVVGLDLRTIDELLRRIQRVGELVASDRNLSSVVYVDCSALYYRYPEDYWDRDPETDPLVIAIETARDLSEPAFASDTVSIPEDALIDLDGKTVEVDGFSVFWEASFGVDSSCRVFTNLMNASTLLFARCYLVEGEELGQTFVRLIECNPWEALAMLENGLPPLIGSDDSPRSLADELPEFALVPLLQHSEQRIRQRAILALHARSKSIGAEMQKLAAPTLSR